MVLDALPDGRNDQTGQQAGPEHRRGWPRQLHPAHDDEQYRHVGQAGRAGLQRWAGQAVLMSGSEPLKMYGGEHNVCPQSAKLRAFGLSALAPGYQADEVHDRPGYGPIRPEDVGNALASGSCR